MRIGNTPLEEIEGIYVKLEYLNPSGSIKDRMASFIIKEAKKKEKIKEIIEATSGNTGISFAFLSALKGYKFKAIMPENMSAERRKIIEAYGGEVILTPKEKDMGGAVELLEKYKKNKKAFFPNQFENPNNYKAYYKLADEILEKIIPDVFIAGIGTGGTIIGVAKRLKEYGTKIIGIEPEESAVLSGGKPGPHKIQGIGEGFIPKIVNENIGIIDEIITIKSNDAIKMQRELWKKGYFVGTSSGANFLGAKKIKNKFKKIVTVFPDSGDRYLSLFNLR